MAKRRTVSRELWERAALDAIEGGGPGAMTVVGLARELGVTKGSFYWHFASRTELLEAALRRWEREHTEELLGRLEQIEDPAARLEALLRHSLQAMWPTLFARLLAAAAEEEAIADAVRRTSQRRLDFLERAYRQLGLTPARARRQALLAYCSYAGIAVLGLGGELALRGGSDRAAQARHAVEALVNRAPGRDR